MEKSWGKVQYMSCIAWKHEFKKKVTLYKNQTGKFQEALPIIIIEIYCWI